MSDRKEDKEFVRDVVDWVLETWSSGTERYEREGRVEEEVLTWVRSGGFIGEVVESGLGCERSGVVTSGTLNCRQR